MGGSNGELQDLTNRLVDRATAYAMEISTEKEKIMSNSTNNITATVRMNGQELEKVTSFKYLEATLLSSSLHQNCLSNGSNSQ